MIRIVGVVLSAVLIMLVVLVSSRRRRFVDTTTSSRAVRVTAPTTRPSPPRLAVELVPKTRWGVDLRSELSAREWKRLRGIVCEAAGNRCEICDGVGRRAPDCNEVWEYDDQQQIQRLVRLEALCAACHAVKHIGREYAGGRGEQARSHLAEVNGWTPTQTDLYLEQQFEQWRVRSEKEWTFDLSALSQYGPPLPPSTRRKRCASCAELFPPDQLTAVEPKRLLCEGCSKDESAGSS
ncbi:hypothetical protein [Nocardia salmonicida]|uniref:hypothetical protein n=1 Tax=Nocardia salmonicida TaxID=53431 RepID=UPI003625DC28